MTRFNNVRRRRSTSYKKYYFCDTLSKSSKKELIVDLVLLRKKISSYRTPKGRITNLPDELLAEILYAWEQWSGPSSNFYKELGADHRKMSALMGRAKKLKREGVFDGIDFTEVKIIDHNVSFIKVSYGDRNCLVKSARYSLSSG